MVMTIRFILICLALMAVSRTARAREWDVLEAGAVPDGETDNTAVFQRLLDDAGKAGGGIVKVPAGRYRINGNLRIPGAVTLEGVFRVPPTNRHDPAPHLQGSVLLAYAGRGSQDGEPFIRLNGNMAVLSGLIVHYPEWRQADVPPVPYPPCVLAQGYEDVGVLDCCLINPYEGIRLVLAARHLVRNVFGYPSFRGLYVDECYDVGRIENCHFWPFGVAYDPNNDYCKWVNTNGVAFEFARTDWHYVLNTFCFGYGVGYKFSEAKAGGCNGNFLGIGADSCRRPVLVEQAQEWGLLITNGEFVGRWASTDSVGVEIGEKAHGKVSLTNCSFWGPIDRCVWHRSPVAQFTATACHFVHWDNNAQGSPAVQIEAGKAILQGNTFGEGELNVHIGEAVRSAVLIGNQAVNGFHVDNRAGKRTQLVANEQDAIPWTDKAKAHYRIRLGCPGDRRYLRRWHGPEGDASHASDEATWRWSSPSGDLILPVLPKKAYTLTMNVSVSKAALSDDAGLYLGEERLAAWPLTGGTVVAQVRPAHAHTLRLEVRCRGWRPSETGDNPNDTRLLGIRVHSVTMRASHGPKKTFNANTGDWIE